MSAIEWAYYEAHARKYRKQVKPLTLISERTAMIEVGFSGEPQDIASSGKGMAFATGYLAQNDLAFTIMQSNSMTLAAFSSWVTGYRPANSKPACS